MTSSASSSTLICMTSAFLLPIHPPKKPPVGVVTTALEYADVEACCATVTLEKPSYGKFAENGEI